MKVAEFIRQLSDEELAKILNMIVLTNRGYSYNDADKAGFKNILKILQSDINEL